MAHDADATQRQKVAGRPWGLELSYDAAHQGDLEFLQWARAQVPPLPWDSSTCANAAYGGHRDVLQWLRENKCPWDDESLFYAVRGGHWHVIQWITSQEPSWPLTKYHVRSAASEGHIPVLQWLWDRTLHSVWDSDTYEMMVRHGRLEALQWLRTRDPPVSWNLDELCDTAAEKRNWVMLQWLLENGVPDSYKDVIADTPDHQHQEYYCQRQWLAASPHRVQWAEPVRLWLHTVTAVSRDRLLWLLCPDVVTLIHRYC